MEATGKRGGRALRTVLLVLAGLVTAVVGLRLMRGEILGAVGSLADGRPRLVFLIVAAGWAVAVLGWSVRLTCAADPRPRRHGRVVLVLLGSLSLCLVAITPGRGSGSALLRSDAEAATGSAAMADAFLAAALAGIGSVVVWWLMAMLTASRPRVASALTVGVLVAYWAIAAAFGVSSLRPTVTGELRDGDFLAGPEVLHVARGHLLAGDDGPLGGFDPGLRAARALELDCEAAAARLRSAPLRGCRRALEVRATGRRGEGAARRDAGSLRALVLQAGGEAEADALAATLHDAAHRSRDAVVTSAESFVLVSTEEPGPGRPLHRALAYLMVGETTGVFIAPP
jgi:hypothetical protein